MTKEIHGYIRHAKLKSGTSCNF